nr:MAG TPA: hypothetical protein [Caudoviricetes sp.]
MGIIKICAIFFAKKKHLCFKVPFPGGKHEVWKYKCTIIVTHVRKYFVPK